MAKTVAPWLHIVLNSPLRRAIGAILRNVYRDTVPIDVAVEVLLSEINDAIKGFST
jgi:hypothetical protein